MPFRVDSRLGRYEEVAAVAPERRATLDAVREAVAALHPDAVETASIRERSVWWGWGPAKMKQGYAYAITRRAHVNFGLFHGVAFPDREGALAGAGKALRHVKLKAPEDARRPAILALLAAARDERRSALNL